MQLPNYSNFRPLWRLSHTVPLPENCEVTLPPSRTSLQKLPLELRHMVYASIEDPPDLQQLSHASPFFRQDVDSFVQSGSRSCMPIMPKAPYALAQARDHLCWPKVSSVHESHSFYTPYVNLGASAVRGILLGITMLFNWAIGKLTGPLRAYSSDSIPSTNFIAPIPQMSSIAYRLRNHNREQFVYPKIIQTIKDKDKAAFEKLLTLHPACNVSDANMEKALWHAENDKAMFAIEALLPATNYKEIDTIRFSAARQDLGVDEFLKQSSGCDDGKVDVGHLFWATKESNFLLLGQLLEKMDANRVSSQAKAKEINRPVWFESASVQPFSRCLGGLPARGLILNRCVNQAVRDKNNLECLMLLIKAGADVNAYGHQGDRPLHSALFFGNLPAFYTLKAAHADLRLLEKGLDEPGYIERVQAHFRNIMQAYGVGP